MKRKIYLILLLSSLTGFATFGATMPTTKMQETRTSIPEAWRGTWEMTVTYSDHETGALHAKDVTTGAICPGERIVPPLSNVIVECQENASDTAIGFMCKGKYSPRPGCNLFVEPVLALHHNGNELIGSGNWRAKVVGHCEHSDFGEDIVVTGRRLSQEAACDEAPASLVHRFFAHGALVYLLGGEN